MNLLRGIGNLFRFDRTNWKAVVLCFVGALVFWVFNAFNKNHSANIRFPLHFEYNHDKYVPVTELPHQININVSGNGWDLFRNQWGLKLPELSIPLERPMEVKKIVSGSLPPWLQPQLGKLHINFIVTDTLRLHIDERDFHRFKVVVDHSDFSFKKGFGRISPIVVLPDSAMLEGPKSILHSMPDSIVVSIRGKQIDQNFSEEIELQLIHEENIKRNPPLVKIMFEVGPVLVIEKKLKAITPGRSQKNFLVDSLSVWFQIPSKRVEEFDLLAKEMTAIVNAKKYNESERQTYHILKMPPYADLVRVDTLRTN
jgi:hypothetical protein